MRWRGLLDCCYWFWALDSWLHRLFVVDCVASLNIYLIALIHALAYL